MRANPTYRDYLAQLAEFVRMHPQLVEKSRALYLCRSMSRGDIIPGSSDIDLVVVVEEDVFDEDEPRDSLREFALKRPLPLVSVPHFTTREAWSFDLLAKPSEFGVPTLRDAKLISGQEVLADFERVPRDRLREDLRDWTVLHGIRYLFALTGVLYPEAFNRHPQGRFPAADVAWHRAWKRALRVQRALLWYESGEYIPTMRDVSRLSASLLGWDLSEAVRKRAPFEELWRSLDQTLCDLLELPGSDSDGEFRFFDWRLHKYFVPAYHHREILLSSSSMLGQRMAEAREALTSSVHAAIVPQRLGAYFVDRFLPQELPDQSGSTIPSRQQDLAARRTLSHFLFSWRNAYLEWPRSDGTMDASVLRPRLAACLEALLIREGRDPLSAPQDVLPAIVASDPSWDGISPARRLLDWGQEMQAAVWKANLPKLAQAVRQRCFPGVVLGRRGR